MKKIALFALMMLTVTPAFAKDVTLTLTDDDQKILASVLDIALKAGGLQNLQPVMQILAKFKQAQGADQPMPTTTITAPPKPVEKK